jgi:hypothetical protein
MSKVKSEERMRRHVRDKRQVWTLPPRSITNPDSGSEYLFQVWLHVKPYQKRGCSSSIGAVRVQAPYAGFWTKVPMSCDS